MTEWPVCISSFVSSPGAGWLQTTGFSVCNRVCLSSTPQTDRGLDGVSFYVSRGVHSGGQGTSERL